MTTASSMKRIPALQAQIGDWYYYITTLTFEEVAQRVLPATELVTAPDMNSWIQRRIIPRRANQIANYLIAQEQHFFPGVVVGVYLGEPIWYEINVEDNAVFGTPYLDSNARETLGILQLDGTEKLYAIDGQHRVAGIKRALEQLRRQQRFVEYERLANETLSIAFVSADTEKGGELERVRRLFTTLNKEAKKVSEPEIVALDEDDAAAIVTRWIAIRYEGLKGNKTSLKETDYNLIQLGTTHDIPTRNRRSITTIVTLYRMVKSVFQQELQSIRRRYRQNRPEEEELESMYQEAVLIWELMRQHDEALNDVLGSEPMEERAHKYRTDSGGHILFRPIGLQAFAGALGLLRTRGVENERAVNGLCQLPMDISEFPWEHIVWNPNTHNMITANKAVAEALFLHMVGHKPRSSRMDLAKRFRELQGLPEGSDPLQNVPVSVLH